MPSAVDRAAADQSAVVRSSSLEGSAAGTLQPAAPGLIARLGARIGSAIGVDRLGRMTGGLVDATITDGRISIELDGEAPLRSLRRVGEGLHRIATQAAAQTHAFVTGRPDALLRIVAQDGELVVPMQDDGDFRLDVLATADPTQFDPTASDPPQIDPDTVLGVAVDVDTASVATVLPDGAEPMKTTVDALGDAVVLLVQGPHELPVENASSATCTWDGLTPALVKAGHRVVVLEERGGDESAACARIATVLGALGDVGVSRVDVVARRSGAAAVERYLTDNPPRSGREHSGAVLLGDAPARAKLRRIVLIAQCADAALAHASGAGAACEIEFDSRGIWAGTELEIVRIVQASGAVQMGLARAIGEARLARVEADSDRLEHSVAPSGRTLVPSRSTRDVEHSVAPSGRTLVSSVPALALVSTRGQQSRSVSHRYWATAELDALACLESDRPPSWGTVDAVLAALAAPSLPAMAGRARLWMAAAECPDDHASSRKP